MPRAGNGPVKPKKTKAQNHATAVEQRQSRREANAIATTVKLLPGARRRVGGEVTPQGVKPAPFRAVDPITAASKSAFKKNEGAQQKVRLDRVGRGLSVLNEKGTHKLAPRAHAEDILRTAGALTSGKSTLQNLISGTEGKQRGLDKLRKDRADAARKGHGGILATADSVLSGKATAGIFGAATSAERAIAKHAGPISAAVLSAPSAAGGLLPGKVGKVLGAPAHELGKLSTNALNDATDLTTNAIPSAYLPAREVARGHVGKAAHMLADPVVHTVTHPKDWEKHPLMSALILRGIKGGVGRGVGKTLRTIPTDVTRKAGSLERPAATRVVPGTKVKVEGRYSKDAINKGVQVLHDKARGRTADSPPLVMKRRQQQAVANNHEAANEDTARMNRAGRGRATHKIIGKGGALHTLVQDNTIAPRRESALAHLQTLRAEGAKLTEPVKIAQNKRTIADVEKALKKADFPKIAKQVETYRAAVRPIDQRRAAHGLIDKKTENAAKWVPYAVAQMGARVTKPDALDTAVATARTTVKTAKKTSDPAKVNAALATLKAAVDERKAGGHLRAPDGHVLKTPEIAAHAHAAGFKEPVFITQAPRSAGARNFRVRPSEPAKVGPFKKRTGGATLQGTADVGGHVLHEQAVRKELEATAAERFKQTIDHVGLRDHGGNLFHRPTFDSAIRDAQNLHLLDPRVDWTPVRINPLAGRQKQLDALTGHVNGVTAHTEAITKSIHDALSGDTTGAGPYTLVPKHIAETLKEHAAPSATTAASRLGYRAGGIWRKNVLGFSPKWIAGNVIEASMRAAIGHAGPRSAITGAHVAKALEKIDPLSAAELRVRARGGGHYSLVDRNSVHVEARTELGKSLLTLARKPGPRHVANAYNAWTNIVFHELNGRFESRMQTVMLGKVLRDHPLMSDHLMKTSRAAAEDVARALSNGGRPDITVMAELGKAVDDMYGQYGKFNPSMRRMIAGYTPFIAWSLNSVNFLAHVLPRDHPVLVGLMASADQASQEWRHVHGLEHLLTRNTGGVPDWLQGGIPGDGGSVLRLNRFTPFGIMAAQGGLAGNAQNLLLPQLDGVLANLQKKDWTGLWLGGSDAKTTDARGALAAATTLLESLTPASQWVEAASGARLPNRRDSAQIPRSAGARLRKLGDPFLYTAPKKGKGTASGFGTGSFGGGSFGSGAAFGSGGSFGAG